MQRPLRTARDVKAAEGEWHSIWHPFDGREQTASEQTPTHTRTHTPSRRRTAQDPDYPLLAVPSDVHLHLHTHAVLPEKRTTLSPWPVPHCLRLFRELQALDQYDAPAVSGALATSPADRASNWRLRHLGNAGERR